MLRPSRILAPIFFFALLVAACGGDAPPGGDAAVPDLSPARDLAAPDLTPPDLTFACTGDNNCGGGTPRCDTATRKCVACLPAGDNCPAGQFCDTSGGGFVCNAGCKTDVECQGGDGGSGARCCNHACVDVSTDNTNCGACGAACVAGNTCCAGTCKKLDTDPNNCGGCGMTCNLANATAGCAQSQCTVASCAMGFADCDMSAGNGCEVATSSDAKNCGACGMVCPGVQNGTAGCSMGTCGVASCAGTFRDCDMNANNGCEVNIGGDAKNCGACGTVCPSVQGGTAGCNMGMCGIGSCSGTLRDCDKNTNNGCEVDVAVDAFNCGVCGTVCPAVQNGTPGCAGGVCGVASCTGSFRNCDMSAQNGCEADVTSDVKHCGACNNACPVPPNAAPSCAAGMCGLGACSGSFRDCDNNVQNGCEANLQTSNQHCGACGVACLAGSACTNGTCTLVAVGGGGSGALNVSGTQTINTVASPASGTVGQKQLALTAPGGFAPGQIVLIHQSQGAGAGAWELNQITGLAGNTATLLSALGNTFTVGGNNHAQAIVVPQHTTVSVPAGTTLTAPPWNGATGGILALLASVSITVDGTVTMADRGYRGPARAGTNYTAGRQGEGTPGPGAAPAGQNQATTSAANGNGGGGGGRSSCECCWGGSGGGGGHGTAGGNGNPAGGCQLAGTGGQPAGNPSLSVMVFGGAGGAGAADEDGWGAGGGSGGGIIYLATPTLNTANGTIVNDGQRGANEYNFSGCGSGGGGGGAGGAIFLRASGGNLGASRVLSRGGGGGDDPNNCGLIGAAGAVGRIHLEGGITGTTSPPAQ